MGENKSGGIKQRLLAACKGHPDAKIPWPHRLLHEAVTHIQSIEAELVAARAEIEKAKELNN